MAKEIYDYDNDDDLDLDWDAAVDEVDEEVYVEPIITKPKKVEFDPEEHRRNIEAAMDALSEDEAKEKEEAEKAFEEEKIKKARWGKEEDEYDDEEKAKGNSCAYIKCPYRLYMSGMNHSAIPILSFIIYKYCSSKKSGGYVKIYNGELMNIFSISEPSVIKHLKSLEKQGFIQSEVKPNKRGQGVWKGYKINKNKCSEFFKIT